MSSRTSSPDAGKVAADKLARIQERVAEATSAVVAILEESGLDFDVYYPHGKGPKAAWGGNGGDAAEVANEEPLPRPPTWFVHIEGAYDPPTAIVSVGLTCNLLPAVGAVYDASTDTTYAARHGTAVSIDGKPMDPSPLAGLESAPITTAICPPDPHETDAYVPPSLALEQNCAYCELTAVFRERRYNEHVSGTIRNLLLAGHMNLRIEANTTRCLLLLITGKATACFVCGPKCPEVCAGIVLVKARGGTVQNIGDVDEVAISPIARTLSSAEARLLGDTGEPVVDVGARRFLFSASSTVSREVVKRLAGPIPYSVDEGEHPYSEDLQIRRLVLGLPPEETNTEIEGQLYNTPRWSDAPPAASLTPVSPEVEPPVAVYTPKSANSKSMFGTMRRKGKDPPPIVVEIDDGPSKLPPPPRPLSRRESEIRRMSQGFSDDLSTPPPPSFQRPTQTQRLRDPADEYEAVANTLDEVARDLGLPSANDPLESLANLDEFLDKEEGEFGTNDFDE